MTVRELINDLWAFKGKICVYRGEIWDSLEFDAEDDGEILSDAEVVEYELDRDTLYIEIK